MNLKGDKRGGGLKLACWEELGFWEHCIGRATIRVMMVFEENDSPPFMIKESGLFKGDTILFC